MASKETEESKLVRVASDFMEQVPFNRELGLEVTSVSRGQVALSFAMQPRFVGNFVYETLHGGVIASVLDVAGGCMALAGGMFDRVKLLPGDERLRFLGSLGTVDMRVDYLRPGRGKRFVASATLLRAGNKVVVTRMELKNDADQLVAVGTGTYLVNLERGKSSPAKM